MSTPGADITARPVDLAVLLDGINDGSVVLPDFQRDFEWSEGEIAALVATAMMRWPAGSLLLMKGAPEFFNVRSFEAVPRSGAPVKYVVLDGQQRLTALYYALRGAGENLYFANATELLRKADERAGDGDGVAAAAIGAEDLEEAIDIVSKVRWEKDGGALAPALRVPLTALAAPTDFFEWRDAHVRSLPADSDRSVVERQLTHVYKNFLGAISQYAFPAVILENDLPAEAVARIFERINRGGIQLSTFDLLVARAYSLEWNLRDEWQRVREETELVDAYLENDGLMVAQGLSLREEGDVRRPALLRLRPALIQREWEDSALAMEFACEFVARSGMRNPRWMPYRTLLIPLAALARDHTLENYRPLLESWLWARALAQDYDVASSTKIAADYRLLDEMLSHGRTTQFEVDIAAFPNATRRQHGALSRTFLSLLLKRGARDLFTGESLVPDPPSSSPTPVVSPLFRKTAGDDPQAPHLRVFGQFLLQRGGARRFQGRAPLLAIRESLGTEDALHDAGATQFLPDPESPDWQLAADELLTSRVATAAEYLTGALPYLSVVRGAGDGAG